MKFWLEGTRTLDAVTIALYVEVVSATLSRVSDLD